MAGDNHGDKTQEEPQAQEDLGQQQAAQDKPQVSGADWGKAVAERDEKIAALEAQVAEAAKNAEAAERLRGEIAELKAQGESDRIDFRLQLAGVRNVKAARAILADHGGDEYTTVAPPTKSGLASYYELKGAGADINFMVVEKSAVIKYDKHVASRVFSPDELEALDSYMLKYRKYGIVSVLENKLDSVYVSASTE